MSTVEIVEADSTAHDLAELNVRVAQWAFQKPGEAMCADSKTVCTGLTQHRGVEGHSFNCSPTLAVRLAEQPFRPIEDKTAMFGDLKHGAVLDHHFSWDKSASRQCRLGPVKTI